MRTFVMGDIHGNYRGLLQCLQRSNFDKKKDKLIQLGDVADGWSQVPQCVEELSTIENLVSIRGNHDIWTWNWFRFGEQHPMWLPQGGQATYDAYLNTTLFTDQKHKDFWNKQIDWYIDDENRLFIHAGWYYPSGFPKGAQMPVNGGRGAKECHWDRGLLTNAAAIKTFNEMDPAYNGLILQELNQFKEIYIGHTAVRYPHLPENHHNLWNLDTGAGWHGKLTIMNVDTKEYWQSDDTKTLYPNELGRR